MEEIREEDKCDCGCDCDCDESNECDCDCNCDCDEATDVNKVVEEKAKEAAENLDKYQRLFAEFDNFRKRTVKEKSEMYELGVMETVEKILPMIDNFERAMKQMTDPESAVYKGVQMIYNQFMDTLKTIGVEEIDTDGKEFDANLHNAVMHIEDSNFGENTIVETFQKGYKYSEKVIRHSMVKVAN